MKKSALAVLAIAGLLLTGCSTASSDTDSGSEKAEKIRVGFGVGMYEQMFRDGILPILEEEGLDIEIVTLSQNIQLNPAMQEGSLDITIFQNTAYMDSIGAEIGSDMSRLGFIPSAPQGVYSDRHKSLDEAKDGSSITVPQDPATLHRAMSLLEEMGWVTINPDSDIANFSLNDLESTKYEFEFKSLDLAQAITSLPDVDYAVINGNYITTSGRLISSGLAVEKTLSESTQLITSVMTEDLDKPWAKAIAAAYDSDEFKKYIKGNKIYEGWVMSPTW